MSQDSRTHVVGPAAVETPASGQDRSRRVPASRWAIVATAGSSLVAAITSGVERSPFQARLPEGTHPIAPLRWAAEVAGLHHLTPTGQGVVTTIALAAVGASFLWLAKEAWAGRVSVRSMLWLGLGLFGLAVLMPLVVSFDAYHYSMYGRIFAIHHANPYVTTPSEFAADPLFSFVTPEWRSVPAFYGPGFMWISGAVARLVRSPAALVLTFKLFSAVCAALTMILVAWVTRRLRPERAAFAVVLVGANPVVVFDAVAAGHFDPLIALVVAGAFAVSILASETASPVRRLWLELGTTAALSLAALLKSPLAVVLILFVAMTVYRRGKGRRLTGLAMHGGVVVAVGLVVAGPFLQTEDPTLGTIKLSAWSNFIAASTILRIAAASLAEGLPEALRPLISIPARWVLPVAFVVAFVAIAFHLARRPSWFESDGAGWAWVLLVMTLAVPILWPWYLLWTLPVAWMLPRRPRNVLLALSAVLPVLHAIGFPPLAPELWGQMVDIGLYVVAPILIVTLWWLLKNLFRGLRAGIPLEAES